LLRASLSGRPKIEARAKKQKERKTDGMGGGGASEVLMRKKILVHAEQMWMRSDMFV